MVHSVYNCPAVLCVQEPWLTLLPTDFWIHFQFLMVTNSAAVNIVPYIFLYFCQHVFGLALRTSVEKYGLILACWLCSPPPSDLLLPLFHCPHAVQVG